MVTIREAVTENKIPHLLDEIAAEDRWEHDEIRKVYTAYLQKEESVVYETLLNKAEEPVLTEAILPLLPDHERAREYVVEWSEDEELAETLLKYVDMLRDAGNVIGWKHKTTGNVFIELGPGTTEDPSEEFMFCYTPDYETRDFVNLATRLKENQLEEI